MCLHFFTCVLITPFSLLLARLGFGYLDWCLCWTSPVVVGVDFVLWVFWGWFVVFRGLLFWIVLCLVVVVI